MNLHSELKKEFQLERLILFSDAVFAIAITLLVLEIKVPDFDRHKVTDTMLLNAMDELVPKFVGFVVSFVIIGLYWSIHHRLFGYVINYTRKMIFLNLVFLFTIVLMPFSTAFYSDYLPAGLRVPVIVYCINIVLLGISNLALWIYATDPKRGLTEGLHQSVKKFYVFRAFAIPAIFVLITIVYVLLSPKYGMWIPVAIVVLVRLVLRYFQPKLIK